MKKLTSLIFLLFVLNVSAQEIINECVFIDFENIPGGVPSEGLNITDQFESTFGITCRRITGEPLILANIGPPITAFGSIWGEDQPNPGHDNGLYFLTDDGMLQGLTATPVEFLFSQPIDSFSGCILDMDFGEEFVIHALDAAGDIILADTIRDGDPGTGDGICTYWGFNLSGCEGTIGSVRFAGFRETAGAFGLGLDNLTFCGSGIDLLNDIELESIPGACDDMGEVVLTNTGGELYEYSMDSINWNNQGEFTGLDQGEYLVYIRNLNGCVATMNAEITEPIPIEIIEVQGVNTSCAEDNGIISITSSNPFVEYSIDGINFQEENTFVNVPPGDYVVVITDADDCSDIANISIDASTLPEITSIPIISEDICQGQNGSIEVIATQGTMNYQYSLNQGVFQSSNVFSNLSAGTYTIEVMDDDQCTDLGQVSIDFTDSISVQQIISTPPECPSTTGSFEVVATGGTGSFIYTLNGEVFQATGGAVPLELGIYDLIIEDQVGCMYTDQIEIEHPECPIYVPNIFSPNGDGLNDVFQIFTATQYDIQVLKYEIFDRWGEKVYAATDFPIHSSEYWWNGIYRNEASHIDVYAYVIEVLHETGNTELLSGDVMLIR